MKKALSLVICLILVFTFAAAVLAADSADSFGAYDHVFIIGVDGAGRFIEDAETPNFDRIFADGAVDYTARAETITISAQNWGSIFTGVSHLKHLLTNQSAEKNLRTSDTKYPSIFAYTRWAYPDAELASFVHWGVLNHGILENDIGINMVNIGDDGALTDAICQYFNDGNAPMLFNCHFDGVDAAGHDHGSTSKEYIGQIETVDGYIGKIYDTLEAKGLMENGLFIVVADHGHLRIGGHFGLTARETNTTVAVKGKTVVKNGKMDKDTRNRDVAAIALYALGIERPDYMTARLPADLFQDVAGEKRPFKNDIADGIFSRLAWIITLLTVWI